jgi:hypothetical protein|tara:strand:- start:893 stop:1003 length:111 start_codon:yes stop_codon:yes gene_type:complete
MKEKFNEWMASIGNVYYANNEMMDRAFEKIDQYEKI